MPAIDLSILNQRQTPAFYADTLANRPAAGFIGRIFVSTNTFAFFRDNGTSWDLIGGPGTGTVTGTGANGQVSFWNGASTISGSNDLFWDSVNGHLGIGTNTPGTALGINHDQNQIIQLNQTTATNDTKIAFQNSGTPLWRIGNSYNAGANDFGVFDITNSLQRLTIKNNGVSELISSLLVNKSATAFAAGSSYSLFTNNNYIVPAGTNFSVSGSTFSSLLGFNKSTYGGNASYLSGQINAGVVGINQIEFSGTGTITMNQSTGLRATAAAVIQNQTAGTVNGTISHLAGLQILGNFANGSSTLTVTNGYGLLINDLNDYGTGFTYTNRWGVYQSGASDKNHFNGNTLIGTTSDFGQKLQVSGTSYLNGNVLIANTTDFGQRLQVTGTAYISGNVGIGTTSPASPLSLSGSADVGMRVKAGSANLCYIDFDDADSGAPNGSIAYNNGTNAMTFAASGNTERMRITSGGNVGIGTSSPGNLLGLQSPSANARVLNIYNGLTGAGDYVSIGSQFATNNANVNSEIRFGNELTANAPSYLAFATGTGTSPTEQLRITSGGNVGIGTTNVTGRLVITADDTQYVLRSQNSSAGNANQFYIQHSAGNIVIGNDRGTVTYGNPSDYRLKEDLKDFDGLDIISKLKTYDFKWIETNIRDYGVIAHEMQQILPNYVTRDKDAINEDGSIQAQSVDYSKIVPILIKAIQELNTKIENLKN